MLFRFKRCYGREPETTIETSEQSHGTGSGRGSEGQGDTTDVQREICATPNKHGQPLYDKGKTALNYVWWACPWSFL